MFMDAISAATTQNEPSKKRKRLSSASKENESTTVKTPESATKVTKDTRNTRDTNASMKVCQVTLASDKIKISTKSDIVYFDPPTVTKLKKKEDEGTFDTETMNEIEKFASFAKETNRVDQDMADKKPPGPGCGPNGPPDVLALHRRKGPKKALRWREPLKDIRYFELHENMRAKTKTFVDMKQMERTSEYESVTTPISTKDGRGGKDENEGHKEKKISEEIKKFTKSEIVSADDEPTVTKKMKKEGEDTSDTETMNEIEELASPDKDSNSEDQDTGDKTK